MAGRPPPKTSHTHASSGTDSRGAISRHYPTAASYAGFLIREPIVGRSTSLWIVSPSLPLPKLPRQPLAFLSSITSIGCRSEKCCTQFSDTHQFKSNSRQKKTRAAPIWSSPRVFVQQNFLIAHPEHQHALCGRG